MLTGSYFSFSFLRMSPERFEHLLSLVGPLIMKEDTNFRKAIPASERLMLTLRFLVSGDSQRSMSYMFLMGKKTVSRIISETTEAISTILQSTYMSPHHVQKIGKK